MKKSLIALILCIFVAGCTSDEGTLKKQGLALARQKFSETIKAEADESLSKSEWLHQAYMDFIDTNSEVEVQDVKIQSPTLATVSTVVVTYPLSLRRTLLGVASSIDSSKSRRFNFADGASLVAQQKGIKLETVKQSVEVYKFSKSGDAWILNP